MDDRITSQQRGFSMAQEFFTIQEVRDQFKCATSTIYRWMEQGVFPRPVEFGGMARWTDEDITDFLNSAVQRRNDAGPRPNEVRRGRKTHSRNKPRYGHAEKLSKRE